MLSHEHDTLWRKNKGDKRQRNTKKKKKKKTKTYFAVQILRLVEAQNLCANVFFVENLQLLGHPEHPKNDARIFDDVPSHY